MAFRDSDISVPRRTDEAKRKFDNIEHFCSKSGMVGPAAASQVLRRQTMGARTNAEEQEENMIPEYLRIFPNESEIERDIQLKNLLGRQVQHPWLYSSRIHHNVFKAGFRPHILKFSLICNRILKFSLICNRLADHGSLDELYLRERLLLSPKLIKILC